MKHALLKTVLLAVTAAIAGVALAQGAPAEDRGALTQEERQAAREARRAQWQAMSEEERTAAREQRRAQWEGMSDEERAAAREQRRIRNEQHRAAARERWETMSEEERKAARERMRQHRDKGSRGRPAGPPPAGG